MKSGNRVILNTAILYTKMVLSILLGLISTRLILKGLGVEDYGIYNLVAGIVSMLTFLNTSLAASSQRFLSFALGRKDDLHLRKVFYYSMVLHLIIGVVVVFLIETIGIYCIKHVLTIVPEKLQDTLSMLHLLSGSVFFSIVSVPYIAVMISRENMLLLSVIEITEALLKLVGVIGLLHYHGNRLILYSVIVACAAAFAFILRLASCRYKYAETAVDIRSLQKNRSVEDKKLLKEMTSFSGWYTFASVGSIGRFQGIPILLNIFFGVVVNAAYGIANQVNGLMQFFGTAILQSIRPQIIKNEGAHDRVRVQRFSLIACRYMFYLCAIFSIPLIIEMPYVLHLWLDNPPEYTVGFCRLVLISTMLFMITCGLGTAIDATGNIKWMYITMGCLHFLNLPIGYLVLKMGMSAYSVLWVIIGEELACMWVRMYLANRIVGISINRFIKDVMRPIVIITSVTVLAGALVVTNMQDGFVRLTLCCSVCGIVFLLLCWISGMEKTEKQYIISLILNLKTKIIP